MQTHSADEIIDALRGPKNVVYVIQHSITKQCEIHTKFQILTSDRWLNLPIKKLFDADLVLDITSQKICKTRYGFTYNDGILYLINHYPDIITELEFLFPYRQFR